MFKPTLFRIILLGTSKPNFEEKILQKQGINYINNLLDESGNIRGYLDFVQKFNIKN